MVAYSSTPDDMDRCSSSNSEIPPLHPPGNCELSPAELAGFCNENPNPLLRIVAGGKLAYANPASQPLLQGWGVQIGDVVPPEVTNPAFRFATEGGRNEIEIICRGRYYIFRACRSGEDGGLNLFGQDVTATKREAASLDAANDRLREALESITKTDEELHRVNRTLKAVSNSSRAIMRADEETTYLKEVCRIVAEDCGHDLVWIGYAENEEDKTIHPAAYAGFEKGYLENIRITWDDSEFGRGPAGTAIRTGKPSICRSVLTDPAFAPWRDNAIKHGFKSTIAIPLMDGNKAFGILGICLHDSNALYDNEVDLLTKLADDLSYGIRALRLRTLHAQAQETVQNTADDLARSNKELEHFAYIVCHDMEEPLRNIRSHLQFLEKRYKGQLDSEADEIIAFGVDTAARLQNLVRDLLIYSRVSRACDPSTVIDTNMAVENALVALRPVINNAGAQVEHEYLPPIKADARQICQLFQCLIDNSVKFRRPDVQPCIRINFQNVGKEWVFCIEDNGIGVDAKYHEKIFTIFQRLHSVGEYAGSGVGLAICKRIVGRHGGRIWVESREDEGSTFYFSIPKF